MNFVDLQIREVSLNTILNYNVGYKRTSLLVTITKLLRVLLFLP